MGSDRNPADEGAYAPAPLDTRTYQSLGDVTVDGETFAVRSSLDDGAIHYDWVSGPNDGYGFSTFGSAHPITYERHLVTIRDFLAGIDPATGYLADP